MDDIIDKLIDLGLEQSEAKQFVEKYPDKEWCCYFIGNVISSPLGDKTELCRAMLTHNGKCPMKKFQKKKAEERTAKAIPSAEINRMAQVRAGYYSDAQKEWEAMNEEQRQPYFQGLDMYDSDVATYLAKGKYCADYANRQTIPANQL